ncbi:MAG: DUF4845 domain-containing protein [Bryobacteraceae bacterium]
MRSPEQLWRAAAGVAVLLIMLTVGVLLIPPYVENWKLQSFINQIAEDPATVKKSAEVIRANIVDRAAALGLPVHIDDVRVTKSGDAYRIDVLYVVHVDLPIYTVDLHFRPAA